MSKSSVAPLFPPLIEDYWTESRRPLMSLLFIAPMLVVYEFGVMLFGQPAVRSGADLWLRKMLHVAGLEQYLLLPLLTCGILLAWHHVRGDRWRIGWTVMYGMLIESILVGTFLLLLGHCQQAIVDTNSRAWFLAAASDTQGFDWLPYLGAGIYEELLFRLILLPVSIVVLQACGLARGTSLAIAVIVGSLLFSIAHYRFDFAIGMIHFTNVIGDSLDAWTFSFRFLAGVLFSLLFVYRGFGVAAGSHALYDIFLASW